MPHAAGKKEEGRSRILASAGRAFRSRGYTGAGIDGMARDAGVTSGAFYAHFSNKDEAFQAAMLEGMRDLREGVVTMQQRFGDRWAERFIDFYLDKRRCDLGESCALQSLSGEVARAGPEVRAAYTAALDSVVDAVANGLAGGTRPQRRANATAMLSLLAGSVTLARAASDVATADAIARAAKKAALALLA